MTVTFNSGSVLEDFLSSLTSQTHRDFLVYAVDNASLDQTVRMLRAWHDPRLRLIENAQNCGIAEANNQGIRAATQDGCDYIMLLNNDVRFEADTFALMLEDINHLGCDLLGPKILFADGRTIWSVGGSFSFAKGNLGFHYGEGELDVGQYDLASRVEHSPACCLLIRKQVFTKIGLIDPKYFVYQDDTDFSFRAWRAGLVMYYTPRARIFHKVSSLTGGAASPFTMRYNTRGHVYFMLKNLGLLRSLFLLPAWELRLLGKLAWRSIGPSEFAIRQRAFLEGIRLWLSRP